MNLILNGKEKQTDAQNLTELIGQLGLQDQAVAVELNCQVVPKRLHSLTALQAGDQLEIVTLVGGG